MLGNECLKTRFPPSTLLHETYNKDKKNDKKNIFYYFLNVQSHSRMYAALLLHNHSIIMPYVTYKILHSFVVAGIIVHILLLAGVNSRFSAQSTSTRVYCDIQWHSA